MSSNSSTPANAPAPAPSTPAPAGLSPAGAPAAGAVARQEFGGTELAAYGDVNAQRAAAEATALVQSRYVMALRNPRDWDNVRVRLMREVERPGFAEAAWYRKPVGAGVEGFSVRFAEAAARCITNMLEDAEVVFDDDRKKVMRVVVTDLESNLTKRLDVTIEKTVERSSNTDGRVAISVRKNSANKLTYLLPATEDEMLGKTHALVSKARRTLVLQILPGDIADEAKARILAIRRGSAAKNPDAFRKQVVDAFADLNVPPSDLKRYLGHDIGSASPAELTDLRDLHSAIKSGEATWAEALAEKTGDQGAEGDPPKPKPGLEGVTDRLKGAAGAGGAAPAGTVAAKDCAHELVRAHLADQAPGTVAPCPQCGQEIRRVEREPGDDQDGTPFEVVKPAEAPKPAEAAKDVKPGQQRRLSER